MSEITNKTEEQPVRANREDRRRQQFGKVRHGKQTHLTRDNIRAVMGMKLSANMRARATGKGLTITSTKPTI